VIPVTGKYKDELLDELDFLGSEDLFQNDRFPEMLNFRQIPRKKICQQPLLVSYIFNCCKAYVSFFQSSAKISPENIEKKSVEVVLKSFVSDAFEYEQEMSRKLSKEHINSNHSLVQHHLKAERKA